MHYNLLLCNSQVPARQAAPALGPHGLRPGLSGLSLSGYPYIGAVSSSSFTDFIHGYFFYDSHTFNTSVDIEI